MYRKRKSIEFSNLLEGPRTNKSGSRPNRPQELTVTLTLGLQRTPIAISVPKPCNMKILKSILWFHLKKNLTLHEYSQIVGFDCIPGDPLLQFRLQEGIGQLQTNTTLGCFWRKASVEDSLLNYKICQLLSVGGFSKVYLMRDLSSGQFVTGKFMLKQDSSWELVSNEFNIAHGLQHPFIVATHRFLETEHFYIIVMEFIPGGELFEVLKDKRTLDQDTTRFYVTETLLALKYLHQQNIIYRDIKPENIMIDALGHVKLTDFGLAKHSPERSYSFCGSIDYMAPEVIEEEGYSLPADYYSVGNLLYELLQGSPPFYHPRFSHDQTKYHIKNTPVRFRDSSPITEEAKSLILGLLQKDPMNRLGINGGIDQILLHPWFKDVEIEKLLSKEEQGPVQRGVRIEAPQYEEKLKEWQFFIERDLKKLQMKICYQLRKQTVGNRRSVDCQVSKEKTPIKYSQQVSPLHSPSKLSSNLSLMFVLTHKRSTSEFPRKPVPNQSTSCLLRSIGNLRKTSLGESAKKQAPQKQSSQDNLRVSCSGWGKKQKSGIQKKRKKDGRQFLRS